MRGSRIVLALFVLALAVASPLLAGKKDKDKSKEVPQETAASAGVAGVVAYVDAAAITLEQVDADIAGRLAKVRQDEYDLRRGALDKGGAVDHDATAAVRAERRNGDREG